MTNENLEKLISGKCPSCKEDTKFKYIRPQEVVNPNEVLHLYNCIKCGSTISYQGNKIGGR